MKGVGRTCLVAVFGVVALLVCAILFVALSGSGEPRSTPAARKWSEIAPPTEVKPTDLPTPTNRPRFTDKPQPTAPVAPSLAEIQKKVDGMTEAQWKPYLRELGGQRVIRWRGWVTDVNVKLGNKYEVWVDMDPPGSDWSTQDVYFPVSEAAAMRLEKGQQIGFSGTIEYASNLFGDVSLMLKDVALE